MLPVEIKNSKWQKKETMRSLQPKRLKFFGQFGNTSLRTRGAERQLHWSKSVEASPQSRAFQGLGILQNNKAIKAKQFPEIKSSKYTAYVIRII